jgi:hypothetical protein
MIIGRPQNIEAFQPLTPPEFAYLRQPIEEALKQGVPLEQQIGVDFNVVCRLLKTVTAMSAEIQRLLADKPADMSADQPSPVASMTDDPVEVPSAEEPPLPFLTARMPIVLAEE